MCSLSSHNFTVEKLLSRRQFDHIAVIHCTQGPGMYNPGFSVPQSQYKKCPLPSLLVVTFEHEIAHMSLKMCSQVQESVV